MSIRSIALALAFPVAIGCFPKARVPDTGTAPDPVSYSGTDTEGDTGFDTGRHLYTAFDTGTLRGTETGTAAYFALELVYGVNDRGEVVPVVPLGALGDSVGPSLLATLYDASIQPMCVTEFGLANPRVTNWSPGDYLSWEVSAVDVSVESDGCYGTDTPLITAGITFEQFVLLNDWQFSIGPLPADAYETVLDPEEAAGGKIGASYLSPVDYFATYAVHTDANMRVTSGDGVSYDPILPADIRTPGGVVRGFYDQVGYLFFAF
jgi:hypothetical protein